MERQDGTNSELTRQAALRQSVQAAFHVLALAIMSGWILYMGRGIIVPFVMAIIVAYVILGLAQALERVPVVGHHLPGWLRQLIAMLVIGAALATMVSLIITNVNQVAAVVPRYQDRLLGIVQAVVVRFGVEEEPTWTTLRDQVLNQIEIRPLISTAVSSVSQIVTLAVVVFIYSGFLIAEHASFGVKLRRAVQDPATQKGVRAIIAEVNDRIGRYLGLKTFVNIVLGAISWAMMTIVGVEFAAFWAILIGLLNYIPYFGSFVGVLFPVLLSALQFPDLGNVILVLVVLTSAQMFVGNILEPYVMGNSLNLSPTMILLGLAFWTALWGIPGAILSVPIMASLLIVLASFRSTRPVAVMLSRNGRVGDPIQLRGTLPDNQSEPKEAIQP